MKDENNDLPTNPELKLDESPNTERPFAGLAAYLQSVIDRAGVKQKVFEEAMDLGDVSRMMTGKKSPEVLVFERLKEVEPSIDVSLCLLWRALGRYLSRAPQTEGVRHVAGVLRRAAETRAREVARLGLASLRFRAIITGDRRASKPEVQSDILAGDASPLDLAFLPDLLLEPGAHVVTDQLVLEADPDWSRESLQGNIVLVGSSSVNLITRKYERAASFGFVRAVSTDWLERISDETRACDYRPQLLRDTLTEHEDRLKSAIEDLATAGYRDPLSDEGRRSASTDRRRIDGVLGVFTNPWDSDGLAVVAAGRTRAATMAALGLLGRRPELFEDRPAGFVFSIEVPGRRAPEHLSLSLVEDAKAVTPTYSLDDPALKLSRAVRERLGRP